MGEIGYLEVGINKNFEKMYFPSNRTRWDKYMLKDMSKYKFQGKSHLVWLEGKKVNKQHNVHCEDQTTVNWAQLRNEYRENRQSKQ